MAMMVGIFIVVLELCARLDDHWHWGAPLTGDYSSEQLRFRDELGHRCRPHAQFEKWRLNGLGFRGDEITLAKPARTTRVLVVGASETFGLYEPAGREYPAQLQQAIDGLFPGRVQVLNAGCAGMSPPRIEQQLRTWLWKLAPDVVVFYPSPQFYLDEYPPSVVTSATPSPAKRFVPRLLRKLKVALKRSLPSAVQTWLRQGEIDREIARHGDGWMWTKMPEERVALFREHLDALFASAKAAGAQLLPVTHANRFGDQLSPTDREHLIALRTFYPRASDTVVLEFERAANRVLREVAAEHHLPVIDAEQALGKDPNLYADFSHFTDEGAAAMARLLVPELKKLIPTLVSAEDSSQ